MPNPTITPWASGATFTVSGSTFAAVDIRMTDIANSPGILMVTAPAGATVHAVRNPAGWNISGLELLGAGGWAGLPVALGAGWDVTIDDSAAAAEITVTDNSGANPDGTLRLLFRLLGGANAVIEPGSPSVSIDRVIADPSINNPQVSSGLPVEELSDVTLSAAAPPTVSVNPAPASPLTALPTVVAAWAAEPDNVAAVGNFASASTNASFKTPAVYEELALSFRLTAAYNLDGAGIASATNPRNEHVLDIDVQTVAYGMVVVLDRSGSMGANFGPGVSRWQAAVGAAHAWLDLFRAFRPGPEHKAGIVTFEHDGFGWNPSTADDVTLRDPTSGNPANDLSGLAGFGTGSILNLGNVQTNTPIGDALVKALEEIELGMDQASSKRAAILLLTDGYENSGGVTIASSAPGAGVSLFSNVRPTYSVADDLVDDRLFTMAVGAQVDEDRLNDLGVGFYSLTDNPTQVFEGFVQMLGAVVEAQQAMPVAGVVDPDSPPHALYFPAEANEQRIAFLVPWSAVTDGLIVAWRAQSAADTDPFQLVDPTSASVQYFRRDKHGLLVADIAAVTGSTAAADWRLQHMAGAVAQPMTSDDALCMVDLALKAEVDFDQRRYFIGDQIRLNCRINLGGARVTGASVGIDVARPGEGLGSFLATNAERYKKLGGDLPGEIFKQENLQGKGLMHAALLHILNMDALPTVTPPAFSLFDDGDHGDGAADDGDYSNVFTDTLKEGTYRFRYRIEGVLPDGSRFSRVFNRSTWVGVRPDALNLVWTTLDDLPSGMLGSLMTFTPKTRSGEFLGPFRIAEINMSVFDGTFDGPLIDNLDGSYSRRLLYRSGQDPTVSIDIYGVPMKPSGPGGKNCWALWVAAFCCTIIGILRFLGLHK